ncbi:MAG: hypothetical protein JSW40_03495 [Candidatus Omnitrophota bacterium]|nr:MAG: hypothetical protein JSW40_03495 [Candidatus Omnitrophota bacterium]
MEKLPEIEGKYIFNQDTKRFHRFKIETDNGLVNGTIYIAKDRDGQKLPKKITLNYADKEN